jgi:hypothetical protein
MATKNNKRGNMGELGDSSRKGIRDICEYRPPKPERRFNDNPSDMALVGRFGNVPGLSSDVFNSKLQELWKKRDLFYDACKRRTFWHHVSSEIENEMRGHLKTGYTSACLLDLLEDLYGEMTVKRLEK